MSRQYPYLPVDLSQDVDDLGARRMVLNMGPSHPSMHGTVRMIVELEGEKIVRCEPDIGYLHRGFEKECEHHTWNQVFPYPDRLNYVSPPLNNFGYALAVEKLLEIEAPRRAQVIRVIIGEAARIVDHLTCVLAAAMELGAFTVFFWLCQPREELYRLMEEVTGARVTVSYGRIGGVAHDLPEGFLDRLNKVLEQVVKLQDDADRLLTKNRIFVDRLRDVANISPDSAKAWGWTGPCLRSTGVAYDVRKSSPYFVYDEVDFDVPVGSTGDNYDRYLVRMEELRQSLRIIHQAQRMLEPGPVMVDDHRIALPSKDEVYGSIEGTIRQFKMVMDGVVVPPGEVYSCTEAANGELGFYLVSDGSGSPYKCRVRSPCFPGVQAFPELIEGEMIADVTATFGSVNMIGGECDR